MARQIYSGDPGEVWTNTTGRLQYQMVVSFSNSCAVCIQFANQIGPLWPIPLHSGCRCINRPVFPDQPALPFLDYREEVRNLDPAQQARVMGRGNLALVESGVVKWEDVVTRQRIRSLREVASLKKLDVDTMVGAGIRRDRAEAAFASVNTPAHRIAEAERRRLVESLKARGVTSEEIRRGVAERLAARVGIGEGPSGASSLPIVITPITPPAPLAAALAIRPPVIFGPSAARVRTFDDDDMDELSRKWLGDNATAADFANVVGAPDNAVVTVSNYGDSLAINFQGDGFRGQRTLIRSGGKLILKNENVEVDARGSGLGASIFGRQVEQASRLGVSVIRTTAGGGPGQQLNGYYTWPRLGYDGPIPVVPKMKLPDELLDAERLSDLMRTPEGRDWWKANGAQADVEFDLAEGSQSRRMLQEYLEAKAEARADRDRKQAN